MGEITLEKKKQIENYIVASYFDRCKNVESYIGGWDIVYGSKSDDIPDILVEVENFSGSGFMIVRWNIIHDQVSELQNEFMVRIATESSITRNRCDSVDAFNYAWVSWKKQLEEKTIFLKDKRIEDLEKEIKALQTENEQLKKKLEESNSMLETDKYLKKLYSIDDVENFKWCLNHTCGGHDSANGWIAISLFWKRKYEALSKIVGFSSYEELHDYLTNEANCETLHEAISKLHDEVKYTCEKLSSANSSNNSWKATAECNSPKELMAKLNQLRDDIEEWKTTTKCKTPGEAKVVISTLTKAVIFNETNKDCPLDFEIKFNRGDEK